MRIKSYPMYKVDLRVKTIIDRCFPNIEDVSSLATEDTFINTPLTKKKYNYKRAHIKKHAVLIL